MILIVDDELDIAEELSEFISATGRDVCFSTSAYEALDLAVASEPEMVISDIRMPEMNGEELVIKLAGICNKDTYFILMSGHLECDTSLIMLSNVRYSFIHKPIDLEVLLRLVERHDPLQGHLFPPAQADRRGAQCP